jgi:hypothetical protein
VSDAITIDLGTLAILAIAAGFHSKTLEILGDAVPDAQPFTAQEIHQAVDDALTLIRNAREAAVLV